jgi:hypothetical protein
LNTIDTLRGEVVDLKITLDNGNKALGRCWSREWKIVQAIKDMKDNTRKQTRGKREENESPDCVF